METLLIVLMVLCAVIIVASILLQPSKGGGISALGGSSQSVFGSTGGTTFLFRVALYGGFFLMGASLLLSRINVSESRKSVIDVSVPAPVANPPVQAPTAPAAPTTETPPPAPSN
jgi:preprotein translocase subunit SecG